MSGEWHSPLRPIRLLPAGWQNRALDRTLADARARDVERMERCVAAARELANETTSAAFTVAQVAARAGLSLKSFYRCFPGKDELLLALLEDDSQIGARVLAERIAVYDEPVAALHAYVTELFGLASLPGAVGYAGVLVREHRRLSEHHPLELRVALAPLVELLAEHIAAATATSRRAPRRRDDVPDAPPGNRRRDRGSRHRRGRARRVPLAILLARARQRRGEEA